MSRYMNDSFKNLIDYSIIVLIPTYSMRAFSCCGLILDTIFSAVYISIIVLHNT